MIKSLVFLSVLAVSVSVNAGENSNSLKKSNATSEATISRLENKQVHMIAKILHKKGRGMIDQKFDDQKLAKQSFSKNTHANLLEEVNSDKYQN